MNPLLFTSPEYVNNRFNGDEIQALQDINGKFEDLKYFIFKTKAIKIFNAPFIVNKISGVLTTDELNKLNFIQPREYDEPSLIYFQALPVIIKKLRSSLTLSFLQEKWYYKGSTTIKLSFDLKYDRKYY